MAKLGIKSSHSSEGTLVRFPREGRSPGSGTPQSSELGSVLIGLIERCHRQVAPGLTIRLSATPGAGAMITWEEAATLDFVVREIVSNAYRYSHPAGSPVEVTMECGVNREGEIVID